MVVSLWEVDDAATSELMTLFHRRLRRGLSPMIALREAKLEMLAQGTRNPYYRGGFVMLGETSPARSRAPAMPNWGVGPGIVRSYAGRES